MKPLYRACMIFMLLPRRTKKVPTTDAKMQTAPITRGRPIIASTSAPAKKIAASNIVATTVTA